MRKHTLIAAILFLLSTTFYGQDTIGTVLVKDIKSYEGLTIGSHNSSSPQNFVEVNGLLYFTVNNANELWKTDGTPMGTQCVKIFNAVNSGINHLTVFGDKLIFSAYNGTDIVEPWISDGTTEGTLLLSKIGTTVAINNSSKPINPYNFYAYNNKVFFSAAYNNTTQLWVTDGTFPGTSVLTITGSGDRDPSGFIPYKDKLVFSCRSSFYSPQLWVTDGTSDSTYELKVFGNGSINNFNPCIFKDKLYFSAWTASYGEEMWRTDGTTKGTALFKDIKKGELRNSSPRKFTIHDSKLYFIASDDTINNTDKLFYTDGDSLYSVKFKQDIYQITDVFVVNNKLLAALEVNYNNPSIIYELNDKTDSLTLFLSRDSSLIKNPTRLTTWNDKLLFETGVYFKYLWITDGTMQNTHSLFPDSIIAYQASFNGNSMFNFNKELYFAGYRNDSIGIELYKVTTDTILLKQKTASKLVSANRTKVYPNPCNSIIAITFDEINEKRHIKVLNILGDIELQTTSTDNEINLDLSQLTNGIYIVLIESKSKTESYKIIKQ